MSTVSTLTNATAHPFTAEWFWGADTYMRMVRVQEWLGGGLWPGDWYANPSVRSNWPMGETLHWTRPLDILLAALALPFWPFFGFEKALYAAGVIVGPVCLLAAIAVVQWGAAPFATARTRVLLVLTLALQPLVLHAFALARPDHHALILLAFAGVFAGLIRTAATDAKCPNAPWLAGMASALGLWVSIEALVMELFALAALGGVWLVWGKTAWLGALRKFTLAGAITLALALFIERPPGEWLNSEVYDRLSTVHVVLLGLIAIGVAAMRRFHARNGHERAQTRLLAAMGAALGTGAIMWAMFPPFFKGPFAAAMDPRLAALWLDTVNEFQPLVGGPDSSGLIAIIALGPAVWTPLWAWLAWRRAAGHNESRPVESRLNEQHAGETRPLVAMAVLGVVLFAPLAAYQARWGGYLGVAAALPWALLLDRALGLPGGAPKRMGAVLGVALGHVLVALGVFLAQPVAASAPKAETFCRWRELAPFLNGDVDGPFTDNRPRVIFTFMHMGPEVLYRTRHRVVGTPYHRNTEGLLDTYTVFTDPDLNAGRAVLDRRGADFVITCVDAHEERYLLEFEGDTLIRRLHEKNPPPWLEAVDVPAGLGQDLNGRDLNADFRIYRVLPAPTSR